MKGPDHRQVGKDFREGSSEFVWGRVLFESFRAGYVKRLNLDTILKLSPLAGRLARLLDKVAWPEKGKCQFDCDVRELVCERMGGTHRELSNIITRLLLPACEELERIELIRKEPEHIRVQRKGRGSATVYFEVVGSLSQARKQRTHRKGNQNIQLLPNNRRKHRIFQGGKFL